MQTLANITVSSSRPLFNEKPVLDIVNERLRDGEIRFGLEELFEDLRERREEEPELWSGFARACLKHSVCNLLHQDPFTHRAFAKAGGYAGGAVMMDYIYGLGEATQAARAATPLGRAIFQYMDTRPSASAVRYRRQLIASLIDRVAENGGTSVLALAAGHLR